MSTEKHQAYIIMLYPYAPFMEYLPTFALKITQMYVNIPYMEHVGSYRNIVEYS